MDNYEIRIIRKGQKGPIIYACPHVNDYAAVRHAKGLTEDGDLVEVWRDMECVYSTQEPPRLYA